MSVCSYVIFCKGLKTEIDTVLVNEPSVFKQLKFRARLFKTNDVIS